MSLLPTGGIKHLHLHVQSPAKGITSGGASQVPLVILRNAKITSAYRTLHMPARTDLSAKSDMAEMLQESSVLPFCCKILVICLQDKMEPITWYAWHSEISLSDALTKAARLCSEPSLRPVGQTQQLHSDL